jgi:hypothetical protein
MKSPKVAFALKIRTVLTKPERILETSVYSFFILLNNGSDDSTNFTRNSRAVLNVLVYECALTCLLHFHIIPLEYLILKNLLAFI